MNYRPLKVWQKFVLVMLFLAFVALFIGVSVPLMIHQFKVVADFWSGAPPAQPDSPIPRG